MSFRVVVKRSRRRIGRGLLSVAGFRGKFWATFAADHHRVADRLQFREETG
jgi:hypothetical protein